MILILLLLSLIQTQQNIVDIKNAWIRTGAKDMNTALFCDIQNNGNIQDTLYDAKSSLSQVVEIHETFNKGELMGMRKTKAVVIKPNSQFQLKPGGHHVMLIKLNKKLETGSKGEVTLYFKRAGEIKVNAVVKR